jgi:itaconate CoA-transferase
VSITGTEQTPCKVPISIADIAAGMYAFSGILTALFAREQSGDGATLDVSLFDALGEWMGFPIYFAMYGGSAPARTGASHATIAPYGPCAAADGQVSFGLQNEREWVRFCADVLQSPQLANDPRFRTNSDRVANRRELDDIINEAVRVLPRSVLVERLDAAQIANAQMKTVDDFIHHPQHDARDRWREIGSPAGPLRALAPPTISREIETTMGPVPAVGEHTDAILEELGYDAAAIAAWRGAGIV